MFNTIREKHGHHVENLEFALAESVLLGLSPSIPDYRALTSQDMEVLFQIIDSVQPKLNYDLMSGACLYVHSHLKEAFARHGYKSELVFGDVLVNGEPHMGCDLDMLKKQLSNGIATASQKVHCWLLLESGQFFDASLFRDITNGIYAAELYGFGNSRLDEFRFEYEPMLLGADFIAKTNPNPQVSI
ncbi:hypothetical protein HYO33_16300 [Vibrio parahaemolyticus]|uniref:hypothetical protein n=1 Tax=Vibrio parahaemolyticus TaxID=670 RepID=UPI0004D7ECE1|nr:hypothetical protein [Vibrio parahaemolyticus]EGQ8174164.1 hypothetical protein [Vibrio vulnificus]EGQ7878071.1 hypothetical protein [Vibrio parahaemolyticus]EGR0228820.1 hypothetical protein [Vibrio parahaemolyticus]EGR1363587.1 hypothetical protein [Vibrio parahaemolyticus]EGR9059723.1 hypothetical protein [Vibrio parahaemolyticus]